MSCANCRQYGDEIKADDARLKPVKLDFTCMARPGVPAPEDPVVNRSTIGSANEKAQNERTTNSLFFRHV